jgi:DNA polymerase III subunit delta'
MPNAENPNATRRRPETFPWHAEVWSRLTREFDRLPHALLLEGQPGLGKAAFSDRLAETLLCAQPGVEASACGHCKSCLLFMAGTHPDLLRLEPAEEGKPITVDQVRALIGFLALRPHTSARKVVIITPAEAMNLNAANSLLKSLEEPPLGNIIMLVSHRPGRLPATVRSRCHRVTFHTPDRKMALSWLADHPRAAGRTEAALRLAAGAPLRALSLAQENYPEKYQRLLWDVEALHAKRDDPVTCAARWSQFGAERSLAWLYGFVCDLIKFQLVGTPPDTLINPDAMTTFKHIIKSFNIRNLFNILDVITEARNLLVGPLDERLLLEDTLVEWCRLSR